MGRSMEIRPEVTTNGDGNAHGAVTAFVTHNDLRLSCRATDETFQSGGDMKG